MAKTTRMRAQSARMGSFEIFSYPQRSTPVRVLGLLWRWRVELLTAVVVVTTVLWLEHFLPIWQVWALEGAVVALVVTVPVSRRWVVAQCWCVISRHRLRSCFVQARVMTREGLLPLFIWTRATPVGERVRLWLRPGLSARDLESVTEEIATACWALDARVELHPKRVSTVWVHIIRRDPLAVAGQLRSPLLSGVVVEDSAGTEVVPLPDRSTVRPSRPRPVSAVGDVPSVSGLSAPTSEGRTARRTARSIPGGEPVGEPVVRGWSGEDVSDYV